MNLKNFPTKLDSKTTSLRITVPENLDMALEGLIRKVLKEQPKTDDVYTFAANYFETLLKIRDKAGTKTLMDQLCPFHNDEDAHEMIKLASNFPKPLRGVSSLSSTSSNKDIERNRINSGKGSSKIKPPPKKMNNKERSKLSKCEKEKQIPTKGQKIKLQVADKKNLNQKTHKTTSKDTITNSLATGLINKLPTTVNLLEVNKKSSEEFEEAKTNKNIEEIDKADTEIKENIIESTNENSATEDTDNSQSLTSTSQLSKIEKNEAESTETNKEIEEVKIFNVETNKTTLENTNSTTENIKTQQLTTSIQSEAEQIPLKDSDINKTSKSIEEESNTIKLQEDETSLSEDEEFLKSDPIKQLVEQELMSQKQEPDKETKDFIGKVAKYTDSSLKNEKDNQTDKMATEAEAIEETKTNVEKPQSTADDLFGDELCTVVDAFNIPAQQKETESMNEDGNKRENQISELVPKDENGEKDTQEKQTKEEELNEKVKFIQSKENEREKQKDEETKISNCVNNITEITKVEDETTKKLNENTEKLTHNIQEGKEMEIINKTNDTLQEKTKNQLTVESDETDTTDEPKKTKRDDTQKMSEPQNVSKTGLEEISGKLQETANENDTKNVIEVELSPENHTQDIDRKNQEIIESLEKEDATNIEANEVKPDHSESSMNKTTNKSKRNETTIKEEDNVKPDYSDDHNKANQSIIDTGNESKQDQLEEDINPKIEIDEKLYEEAQNTQTEESNNENIYKPSEEVTVQKIIEAEIQATLDEELEKTNEIKIGREENEIMTETEKFSNDKEDLNLSKKENDQLEPENTPEVLDTIKTPKEIESDFTSQPEDDNKKEIEEKHEGDSAILSEVEVIGAETDKLEDAEKHILTSNEMENETKEEKKEPEELTVVSETQWTQINEERKIPEEVKSLNESQTDEEKASLTQLVDSTKLDETTESILDKPKEKKLDESDHTKVDAEVVHKNTTDNREISNEVDRIIPEMEEKKGEEINVKEDEKAKLEKVPNVNTDMQTEVKTSSDEVSDKSESHEISEIKDISKDNNHKLEDTTKNEEEAHENKHTPENQIYADESLVALPSTEEIKSTGLPEDTTVPFVENNRLNEDTKDEKSVDQISNPKEEIPATNESTTENFEKTTSLNKEISHESEQLKESSFIKETEVLLKESKTSLDDDENDKNKSVSNDKINQIESAEIMKNDSEAKLETPVTLNENKGEGGNSKEPPNLKPKILGNTIENIKEVNVEMHKTTANEDGTEKIEIINEVEKQVLETGKVDETPKENDEVVEAETPGQVNELVEGKLEKMQTTEQLSENEEEDINKKHEQSETLTESDTTVELKENKPNTNDLLLSETEEDTKQTLEEIKPITEQNTSNVAEEEKMANNFKSINKDLETSGVIKPEEAIETEKAYETPEISTIEEVQPDEESLSETQAAIQNCKEHLQTKPEDSKTEKQNVQSDYNFNDQYVEVLKPLKESMSNVKDTIAPLEEEESTANQPIEKLNDDSEQNRSRENDQTVLSEFEELQNNNTEIIDGKTEEQPQSKSQTEETVQEIHPEEGNKLIEVMDEAENNSQPPEEELCRVVDSQNIIKIDEADQVEPSDHEQPPEGGIQIKTIKTHYYDFLQVPETITREYKVHRTREDSLIASTVAAIGGIPVTHQVVPVLDTTSYIFSEDEAKKNTVKEELEKHDAGDVEDITTPSSDYSINVSELSTQTVSEFFLDSERRFSSLEKEETRFTNVEPEENVEEEEEKQEETQTNVEELITKTTVPGTIGAIPLKPRSIEEISAKTSSEELLKDKKEDEKLDQSQSENSEPLQNSSGSKDGGSIDSDTPIMSVEVKTVIETQVLDDDDEEDIAEGKDYPRAVILTNDSTNLEVEVETTVEVADDEEGDDHTKEETEIVKENRNQTATSENTSQQAEETTSASKEMGNTNFSTGSNNQSDQTSGKEGSSVESDSTMSSSATKIKRSDSPKKNFTRSSTQNLLSTQSLDSVKRGTLMKTNSLSSFRQGVTDFEVWNTIEKELEEAATKIQSKFRGYRTRKKLQREDAVQITTESSRSETPVNSEEGQSQRSTGEFHDSIVLSIHPR